MRIKSLICLLLALLLALPALAEGSGDSAPANMLDIANLMVAQVSGELEPPALENPEARYGDAYMEQTDGSDGVVLMTLAAQNNDEADLAEYGAIRYTDHFNLDESGEGETLENVLQDTPYGLMLIQIMPGMAHMSVYMIKDHIFVSNMGLLEEQDPPEADEYEFRTQTFRFPYLYPDALNGMRQDDNGYTYFLIRTDDETSVEYVTGDSMKIVQTRVYTRDSQGMLRLESYMDYRLGDPVELPQDLLDELARVAEPVATPEPSTEPETPETPEPEPTEAPVEGEAEASDEASDASDEADDSEPVIRQLGPGGPVKGDFDAPALSHPEERYEYFVQTTDGSEYPLYVMLDAANDEAEDMKDGHALHIIESWAPTADGNSAVKVHIYIQESPYGPMMISQAKLLWMSYNIYYCGPYAFMVSGDAVEATDAHTQEEMDFYTESYHFPYGSLEAMNGVRQDDNGYSYFFITGGDNMAYEYVVGDAMRILQLRVYMRDDDGVYNLHNYVDYDVVPALEVPQAVLDAFGEVMEPLPEATEEPDAEEETANAGLLDAFKNLLNNNSEEEPES